MLREGRSASKAAVKSKPPRFPRLPGAIPLPEAEVSLLGADVLSQVKDVVFAFDQDLSLVYWNRSAELLYGFNEREVLGHRLTEVVQYCWTTPDEEKAWFDSIRSSGSWRGEIIHFAKNGKRIYMEGSVSVLDRPHQRGPIYVAINRDVTERKRAEAVLRHAQTVLQDQVQKRTAELEEANEKLHAEVEERRATEEALRETEQQLHSILDTSPSIVFLKDTQGRYLYVNPQFQKLTKVPREQIPGKTDGDLFPAEQAQVFHTNDLHVLKARAPMEFEEVAPQRDGFHTGLVTRFPLMNSKGEVYAIAGIVTDITERILAERALYEANTILKEQAQLLDLAQDAIIVRDLSGVITFWNRGAEKMYGWTRPEAQGKILYELLQTLTPIAREEIHRKIVSEGSWEGELYHIRRDGERIAVTSRLVLQHDGQGRPLAVLIINRDVTDRKRAESALRETQERFRLIVENVKDYSILMLDTQGRILTWNIGAERIKGFQAEEMIGEHFSRFYTPEDVEQGKPQRLLDAAQAEGQVRDEGWRLRKDGTRFWADVTITALRDENGDLRGFGKVTRDLTERKQAELTLSELSARLLQKQDEERRAVARELHDSTSPGLTMLVSKLQQVRKQAQELGVNGLEALSDSIALAESLAREITTVSYLLHPPLLEGQGLNAALSCYLEGYVRRTGIRVETELPARSLRLPKEMELVLFRIVQEALTNILRHSGSPAAKVSLSSSREQVRLEVSDQGCGIPEHVQERWRAGGIAELGVGIAGMQERLRQLGGNLEIKSDTQGTVVRAALPSRAWRTAAGTD